MLKPSTLNQGTTLQRPRPPTSHSIVPTKEEEEEEEEEEEAAAAAAVAAAAAAELSRRQGQRTATQRLNPNAAVCLPTRPRRRPTRARRRRRAALVTMMSRATERVGTQRAEAGAPQRQSSPPSTLRRMTATPQFSRLFYLFVFFKHLKEEEDDGDTQCSRFTCTAQMSSRRTCTSAIQ